MSHTLIGGEILNIEREGGRSARFSKKGIPDFYQSWECTYHERIIRYALPFDLSLTFADTESKSAHGFRATQCTSRSESPIRSCQLLHVHGAETRSPLPVSVIR